MHSLLGESWEIWLGNEKVSTAVKHWLLEHTCGQAAWGYWSNKFRFYGMDIKSIDWATIETVVTRMTIKQWQWATKFTTGFCTMGQMMKRWGQRPSAACLQLQTRNQNHSAYTTMSKYSSPSNWHKKPTGIPSAAKRFGYQTKHNGRPECWLPYVELKPTPNPDTHQCWITPGLHIVGQLQPWIPSGQLANTTATIL